MRRIARGQTEAETLQLSDRAPRLLTALARAASSPFVSFLYKCFKCLSITGMPPVYLKLLAEFVE